MRLVLDTCVVIDNWIAPHGHECAVSTATLAELEFGVLAAADDTIRSQRLARLLEIQRRFEPLPFDQDSAHFYARFALWQRSAGRDPRKRSFDTVIAATTRSNGAALVTHNVSDFAPFTRDLQVLTPLQVDEISQQHPG